MENSAELAIKALHSCVDTDEMFLMQLERFLESENCCMTYPKFYNSIFRQKIINLVQAFSVNVGVIIKWRVHEYNGFKFLKIYKPSCNSYIQEHVEITISENTKKLICKYLHECSLTLKEQVELYPGFQKSEISKPRIQVYHFSMNKQNNTITIPPKTKSSSVGTLQKGQLSIDHHRNTILQIIAKNQVTVFTYDVGIDKLGIPQMLLESFSTTNEHCRIVYSNIQKFVAIKNSEDIAKRRGEIMGITTGYQIPLKSVSSCNNTNLLFTSTAYFLRCLMGVNSKDVFYGITHVILDDVQERDFQTDLLLFEIRETLSFYPNLKILLLCSNPYNIKSFEDYFKKIGYFNLRLNSQIDKNVQIHNLNKILQMLNYLTPEMESNITLSCGNKKITLKDKESQLIINSLLDRYINESDIEAFDKFFYLVQVEQIPVDVQHSEYFMNMLMGAAKNNEIDHLKTLLKLNANIYLKDCNNQTAQDWAKNSNNLQCLSEIQKVLNSRAADEKLPEEMQRLKAYHFTRATTFEVDHFLVTELLKFLHTKGLNGSILIFTPCYEDMLKIQYYLENYFKHNKIENYIILKLHNNNKMSEIDDLLKTTLTSTKRKIIFSTETAEAFLPLNDVLYVVDTGLIKLSNHSIGTSKIQWISKDRAERRKCMAAICETFEGVCFRLYTAQNFSNFSQVITPELIHMPLDNVCLFVKVLSPYTTIKEYFTRTISTPSNGQIEKSIQLLKTIGALEEQESITTLGMRLVDIPLPAQLGKVLIYGIFMQCLDPVLTIISILHFNDQFIIPDSANNHTHLCIDDLTENSNSDHLKFLRVFQKWQDDRLEFIFQPMSLEMFLLDQKLQVVCEIRSEIVGIVRSAQLIHANGLLSMNYINSFANNWSMVKASFTAGMYPNICHIEKDHHASQHTETKFKCNTTKCTRKLFLQPGSILRDVAPDSWNKKSVNYQTGWLFYQNEIHREKVCRIHNSTLITPITIALFAGNLKKSEKDLVERVFQDDSTHSQSNYKTNTLSKIIIDDWISFETSKADALLVFHLRQKFSHIFLDLLQNCDVHEKIQRFRRYYMEKLKILETISKILQNEDINHNFPQLERIGERPKALPLSCVPDVGISTEKEINLIEFDSGSEFTVAESTDSFSKNKLKSEERTDTDTIKDLIYLMSLDNINEICTSKKIPSTNKIYLNNQLPQLCMTTNYSNLNDGLKIYSKDKMQSIFFRNSTQNMNINSNEIIQNIALPLEFQNNSLPAKSNESKQPCFIPNHKEIFKYSKPGFIIFYILPCLNRNDALEYIFQNKFNKNCLPLWNEICLQFIKNTNIIRYVFLFDTEEACFCSSGYIIWNGSLDGIRLHEVFKVNFKFDRFIARLKLENRYSENIVNYVCFGEIHYQFGYDLMYCSEIFQKILEND